MKPKERRRLGAEQAILRRFKTFTDCNNACIEYARRHNIDTSFNDGSVARYVSAYVNFSVKRLSILASILGVTNYKELDEIFTAPEHRGVGYEWVGEFGNKAKDIKIDDPHFF